MKENKDVNGETHTQCGQASWTFVCGPWFANSISKNIPAGNNQEEVFSLRDGLRITASWLVIRRPSARSTLAPRASLLRLSDFSVVGTNLCAWRGLFSRRSRPSPRWVMSRVLGSPLGRLPVVRSEVASEGLPLMVEKRLELRF